VEPLASGISELQWAMSDSKKAAHAVIAAPFGKVGVAVIDDAVHTVEFLDENEPDQAPSDPFLAIVIRQLEAYFRNPAWRFTLPLIGRGSDYRRRIWEELARIKAGEVQTYGAIARRLSSGPRAVGAACRANPLPIIIPCHRVVAAGGLGGFAGETAGTKMHIKRWLLAHEGVTL
jgi:methylated-DNA-[protein]-cysteine S-methyltransferase